MAESETPWLTREQFDEVQWFDIHRGDSVPMAVRFEAEAEAISDRIERVRSRLAPAPTEGMLKTPDEMIDDLEWAKYGTGQIALALKQAGEQVRDARKSYREARASVIDSSDARSADKREAEVDLRCASERDLLDLAEVVQDFAKNVARSIEQTGSMTQTQANLLRSQLALAGSGRES